jgi:hypothetical protein
MRWSALWTLLPDEALPLLIMVAGLMMVIGFRRAGLSLLGLALLTPILAPVIEALIAELPPWLSLVILILVGLSILRGLSVLLIGPRATDQVVGSLVADIVRPVVNMLFFFLLVGGVLFLITR